MAWTGTSRREHSRDGLRYPSDLTDREWALTAPFIPPAKSGGRRRTTAKGKTDIARLWDYVRDDRPFGGTDPPAVVFYHSRDRRGEHAQAHLAAWSGILQADAFAGYSDLNAPTRQPGLILDAGCFAHARRKFFALADVEGAARKMSRGEKAGIIYPIALEAVLKLDALFDIERSINGKSAAERFAVRRELSVPLMVELHDWLKEQLAKLSRNHDLAKAINYMLRRWGAFTRFHDDGRICLTNNAAERAPRCAACLWAGRRGSSPVPIAVVSVLPSFTHYFRPAASTTAIRRPG